MRFIFLFVFLQNNVCMSLQSLRTVDSNTLSRDCLSCAVNNHVSGPARDRSSVTIAGFMSISCVRGMSV